MLINATAKLKYKIPSYDAERLLLIIKFKEPGNLLRTKIVKEITRSYYWDDEHEKYVNNKEFYNELLECVNNWVDHKEIFIEVVEELIMNYFKDRKVELENEYKFKQFKKQLKNLGKIQVKVEIK